MSKSASHTPNLPRKYAEKATSATAGGIDEDFFYNSFSKIVLTDVASSKELSEIISSVSSGLSSSGEDWEKKRKCLKTLQSVTQSLCNSSECTSFLRSLHIGLQGCLSDLRSQVVREACLTIGYFAHILKLKMEVSADFLMPQLLVLVPNSAKIVSTSACVCLSIMVTNVQSPKVMHHVVAAITSKSSSTRRFSSKLLEVVCSTWDSSQLLERQISGMQTAIDRGMGDADQETRASSRRAFAGFALQFPKEAESMFVTMDASRRTILEKELDGHPAQAVLKAIVNASANKDSQVGQGKRRTSCPPTSLKLGSSSLRRFSEDTSGAPKFGYNSLSRTRVRGTNKSGIPGSMTTSQVSSGNYGANQNLNGRGSNLSLTGRSSDRNTPSSVKKLGTNGSGMSGRTTPSQQQQQQQYKYRPSGASSASLPRRKNNSANKRNNLYTQNGDGNTTSYTREYGSRRKNEFSDDNASDASSIDSCSELSRSSLRAQKPTENVPEILKQLSSYQWSDKRDGLINLQNILNGGRLSPSEVKKVVEVLNHLFSDTKSKIFPLFLSTIQILVESHQKYLSDWLYSLLLNLLSRQAGETISGRQKVIQDTLTVIRSQFPLEQVISSCCRVVGESYQNTSMKLKLSVLGYLKTVVIVAPGPVMQQCLSSLTPTVNVLAEWATDSKWSEIRKLSSGVLVKLKELHSQVLDAVSHCLSVTVRHKIVNLVKHSATNAAVNGGGSASKTSSNSSATYGPIKTRNRTNSSGGAAVNINSNMLSATVNAQEVSQEDIDRYIRKNTEDLQALSVAYDRHDPMATNELNGHYRKISMPNTQYRSQLSDSGQQHVPSLPSGNLDPNYMISRYQSSLRPLGTGSTDILDYGMGSRYHHQQQIPPPPPLIPPTATSINNNNNNMLQPQIAVSSPYQFMQSGGNRYGSTGHSNTSTDVTASNSNNLSYSCYPSYYDSACYGFIPGTGGSTVSLQEAMYPGPITGVSGLDMYLQTPSSTGYQMLQKIADLPPVDMVSAILSELCYLNQRNEQRKACLLRLLGILRENAVENWDELFQTTLMRLFDTAKDNDANIRALVWRVIQDLTKVIPERFDEYTHITILRTLQAHKDQDKTVVKAAEECAQVLAQSLSHELCVRVLSELVIETDVKINLGALKMLLEVLRVMSEQLLIDSLPIIVPGLVKTSDHEESHIRKASIFCLVEVHKRIGEKIWTFLSCLSSSKARLLRLYIDKNRNNYRMTESTSAFP